MIYLKNGRKGGIKIAEQETNRRFSEEEKLKQMAAQLRAAEYKDLSEKEIQEKERQKEMRRKKNIEVLEDTLHFLKGGHPENVRLHFSQEQMREVQVFLPEDIKSLQVENSSSAASDKKQISAICCVYHCENTDTLAFAQKKYRDLKKGGDAFPRVLVLNLASATQPGGRTRKGASAQEEDLCRRTSLLLSLESESAKKYYDYNRTRKTRMGSDAVMLSPCVEVLKDSSFQFLSETFPISVMSCSAPMIRLGLEGMSQQKYEEMLYQRILGMFFVAASQKYRHLILGAFGCGVYGNDAALVSNLFDQAIHRFHYNGKDSSQLFESIDFAILCRPDKDYNYREFCRNFSSEQ